jgi:hypothetical protein
LEVNIFDYPASTVMSLQGTLEKYRYNKNGLLWFPQEETPTLDKLLSFLGGIPDPEPSYSIETVEVFAVPKTIFFPGLGGGYLEYVGHTIKLLVTYSRLTDTLQHTADWVEVPGTPGTYYFTLLNNGKWHAPKYETIITQEVIEPEPGVITLENRYYISALFTMGEGRYQKEITNAISFNALLEGILECTGLTLVSNFFGINPDGSYPANEVYSHALFEMQDVRIVQSYDVIRAQAIEDSFGNSGKIKAKKFIEALSKFLNLVLAVDTVANVLRFEHISYFQNKGLDFTTNGAEYGITEDIEVNKDLISSETWRMPAQTPNGYETKINYDVIGETQDKEYQIEIFLTDLTGTINNEDYEKDEYKKLFYLLSTDGQNVIALNSGFLIDAVVRKYHYMNRVLPRGLHDGKSVSFSGYSLGLTTKLAYEGSLKDFVKLNPGNSVKTSIGTFMIESMEYSKGVIKMGIKK